MLCWGSSNSKKDRSVSHLTTLNIQGSRPTHWTLRQSLFLYVISCSGYCEQSSYLHRWRCAPVWGNSVWEYAWVVELGHVAGLILVFLSNCYTDFHNGYTYLHLRQHWGTSPLPCIFKSALLSALWEALPSLHSQQQLYLVFLMSAILSRMSRNV